MGGCHHSCRLDSVVARGDRMSLKAYILFNKGEDKKVETETIKRDEDGKLPESFGHDGQNYNIRRQGIFLYKDRGLTGSEKEIRSYYRGGHPVPIMWERPDEMDKKVREKLREESDKISWWAEDLKQAEMESTSWADMFKIGGGSSSVMGWALVAGVIIAGIIAIVMFLPQITGGGGGGLPSMFGM